MRARLHTNSDDLDAVNEAFTYACHLQHESVAALLLDRSIALDPEMGRRIDGGPGRSGFIQYFIENKPDVHDPDPFVPWEAFVRQHVMQAMLDGDLPSFVGLLCRDGWLLGHASVKFQVALIEQTAATLTDRAAFLKALLDLDPAVLHSPVPSPSSGIPTTELPGPYTRVHIRPEPSATAASDDLADVRRSVTRSRTRGFRTVRRWFDVAGLPWAISRIIFLPTMLGSAEPGMG